MTTTAEVLLRTQDDVVAVRQLARRHAVEIGLSLIDQTKFVTAASELGRNTVVHGGGGIAKLEIIQKDGQDAGQNGSRRGIRISFEDQGPGIRDIERALQDGFTTGGGLGLGLGGAKRLTNEFVIESSPERGTRVTITQWGGR